jgi:hypothetical protein
VRPAGARCGRTSQTPLAPRRVHGPCEAHTGPAKSPADGHPAHLAPRDPTSHPASAVRSRLMGCAVVRRSARSFGGMPGRSAWCAEAGARCGRVSQTPPALRSARRLGTRHLARRTPTSHPASATRSRLTGCAVASRGAQTPGGGHTPQAHLGRRTPTSHPATPPHTPPAPCAVASRGAQSAAEAQCSRRGRRTAGPRSFLWRLAEPMDPAKRTPALGSARRTGAPPTSQGGHPPRTPRVLLTPRQCRAQSHHGVRRRPAGARRGPDLADSFGASQNPRTLRSAHRPCEEPGGRAPRPPRKADTHLTPRQRHAQSPHGVRRRVRVRSREVHAWRGGVSGWW